MKQLRRVTEPEVIAEFLKNEFYQEEFHQDREQFETLVMDADTTNDAENALRRALLFRRRGHMWRELPADTQWWDLELEPADLERVRVFPRAQWRRVADGSFYINDIVKRIRAHEFHGKDKAFISKVHALSYRLRQHPDTSTIMLIGIDDASPLTILEGNHRLTAALLVSPALARDRFRVVCGFSRHMNESCWYETNLANLWRYAKNRFRNIVDREADVSRVLAATATASTTAVAVAAPGDAAAKPALAAPKTLPETE
jgi:hypothetical protein